MNKNTKRSVVIGSGLAVALGVSGAIFAGCSNTTAGEVGTKPTSQSQKKKTESQPQVEQAQAPKKQTTVSPSALPKELTQTAAPKTDTAPSAESDSSLSNRKDSDDGVTGEYKAAAVLINKYSIIYNGQFQYIFELRMTNDNGSKVVNYYTTKNVFDTATQGDTYKVTYAGDADGNLAIRTISQ